MENKKIERKTICADLSEHSVNLHKFILWILLFCSGFCYFLLVIFLMHSINYTGCLMYLFESAIFKAFL